MLSKPLSVQEKINKLVSLYEKDLLKEALIEAKSLANQHPNVSVIYNIYGMINNVLGNWDQSVICFSKAIKLNPAYADVHYNLGIAQDSLERLEEAILSYTKAIELKPNYPKFYEGLIRLLTFYKRVPALGTEENFINGLAELVLQPQTRGDFVSSITCPNKFAKCPCL